MTKLFSIGEILIDFIPQEKGRRLKDVLTFEKAPGGAPANVAAAVAKYGVQSYLISKVGNDAFGDSLIETLENIGVGTEYILRTSKANTGLAFVALSNEGERQFSFYRNPSADLLFEADEIDEEAFDTGDYLHFCSVDLVESPMKYAHYKAIENLIAKQGIISFDPNVTQGGKGATILTRDKEFFVQGFKVDVVDTTGAGDAFIGGFLYVLLKNEVGITNLKAFIEEHGTELLSFSNASGALTTMNKGGISALPALTEILEFIKKT